MVDVQKGAIGFRGENDNRCASFIQFTFSSLLSYDNSPQRLPCPCLLCLGSKFLQLMKRSLAPFSLALCIVAKLL